MNLFWGTRWRLDWRVRRPSSKRSGVGSRRNSRSESSKRSWFRSRPSISTNSRSNKLSVRRCASTGDASDQVSTTSARRRKRIRRRWPARLISDPRFAPDPNPISFPLLLVLFLWKYFLFTECYWILSEFIGQSNSSDRILVNSIGLYLVLLDFNAPGLIFVRHHWSKLSLSGKHLRIYYCLHWIYFLCRLSTRTTSC